MFNKKILFAVLIVAILSATVGSVVGGQDAPTVYVSPSGNDGNTGTSDAPFKTIKKAVEAAPNGGTVFIKAGLYYAKDGNGNIKTDKDLNIVGEDKETTIIDGSDFKNTLNERGELVRSIIFESDNIRGSNQTLKIKNLTFQNQVGYSAIVSYSESTESTVENCNFIKNQGVGLIHAFNNDVGSKSEFKVLNCSFTNNSMQADVVETRCSYSIVAGCSFVDNRVECGAALNLGLDALVSDSYFSGNIHVERDGHYADDIYHCTVYGTIKLHNNVFIQARSGSTRSIWNEYGVTEYV
ncbi:MAG: DUF1565 domain-containing protein [Methanobrevibacter sp.]|jgi:hypothetical protein|nr:DUF1565 domain-containing protein [Candidatus Methanovirga australis]